MENTSPRFAFVAGSLALGGVTTFLISFTGELSRRGIPVKIIGFEEENPMGADFQSRHVPVLCLNQHRLIFEDRLKAALKDLALFQPTVVISTLGGVSYEILRYLPKGVFRVAMGHSDHPNVYKGLAVYAPWSDLLAVVSQHMKDKSIELPALANHRVEYLPCGISLCPESELPVRDLSIPLRILYIGRLTDSQKRVRLFPEIWRDLCASGISFQWTIAGEGEERAFLEENIKSNSPSQAAFFTGHVPYDQVPALLKEHDILLLASDHEGLPLSLLEAMNHGLVPVVSDLKSGIPEVVDETIGILVPVDDVAGYARAILYLDQNRSALSAKSKAARERVKEKFSAAAMIDRWLELLPPATSGIVWPKSWSIRFPILAENSPYFSRPMRVLRRLAMQIRFLISSYSTSR